MKKSLLLCLLLIASCSLVGQINMDSISVQTTFAGCRIFQGYQQLTLTQLASIVQVNEEAYKQVIKAQTTNTISTIIGGIGGALMGYPLGTVLGGGKANWTMFGIGAGLAVISIPIFNKTVKQIVSSVDLYNRGFKSGAKPVSEFKFGIKGNGLAIAMTF